MRKNKTKNKKTSKSYKKPPNNKKLSPPVVPPKKTSAGKKLYDSEEVFRALADASPVGVYLIQDGVIKYVNRKSAEILGYTIQEMEVKLQLKDFIPEEDIPRAEETIRKRLTGKLSTTYYDGKFIRKDKKLIDVEVYGSRIQYHGKPAVIGSLLDVTVRKQSEQLLIESEEKFRTFSEALLVGVYIIQDGVFRYVNPMAAKILGYSVEAVINRMSTKDIIVPEEIKSAEENIQKRMSGLVQERPTMFRAVTKDKRIIDIETYGTRIMYNGRPAVLGSVLDITSRKQSDQRLMESEEKFRTLAEAAVVGVYIYQDGIYTYINPRAAEIMGYTVEEALGKLGPKDIVVPEDMPFLEVEIQKRLSGEVPSMHYEVRSIRKDKKLIYCEVYDARITYQGRPAIMGSFIEITARKEAEENLRESEEKFRMLTESSLVGVYLIQNNVFKYVNPMFARIVGYSIEELIDKIGPKDVILSEDWPMVEENLRKRISGEVQTLHYLTRGIRKDKTVIDVELYSSRMTYNGKPAVFGSVLDITERKKANLQLMESEEKFRMLAETSLVGVYVLQDNVFKYVNPVAARMFGYSVDEVIDKIGPEQIVIPEDLPVVQENVRKRVSGEIETKHYEFRGITKDKRTVEIEIYGSRILYHGRPAIVGSVIDITERNRAVREKERMQAQVFQLQKMEAIGIMTGGVAHDLNNILTVIQGHAELGILRLNENKSLRHDLDEILDASIKGTNLTHQLLLFGRKSPVELAPLNINATTNDLLKMLKRLIGEHVKIVLELAGDIWMIMADTGNVQQVIMNLVINASHAIIKDGTITIRTENSFIDEEKSITIPDSYPGNYVCLSVTDTGTGIDTEIINRIFEPFFTTKDKEKGTGLGLSVVYGIAKQHNGWINVYSKLGEGTTFKVYFPAVLQIHETTGREKLSFKDLNGNGERILLVEDEESMLNFVKIVLSENGYQVFPASNAEEAVSIFKRENNKFDLLFSDVVLPDSNGIRLADELLSYKPGLICLLTSGYTDEKSQSALIQERGYPFIQKPYTLHDLFRMIKDLIADSRQAG